MPLELLTEVLLKLSWSPQQRCNLILVNRAFSSTVHSQAFRQRVSQIQFQDCYTLYDRMSENAPVLDLQRAYLCYTVETLPVLQQLSHPGDSQETRDQLFVGIQMLDCLHHTQRRTHPLGGLATEEERRTMSHKVLAGINMERKYRLWAPFMRFTLERLFEFWISKHGISTPEINEFIQHDEEVIRRIGEMLHMRAFERAFLWNSFQFSLRDYFDDNPAEDLTDVLEVAFLMVYKQYLLATGNHNDQGIFERVTTHMNSIIWRPLTVYSPAQMRTKVETAATDGVLTVGDPWLDCSRIALVIESERTAATWRTTLGSRCTDIKFRRALLFKFRAVVRNLVASIRSG